MATIDELHAQSVQGDLNPLMQKLIGALRTGAEFVSPPANGPGAAAVAGIRSLLPGSGSFSQEFDRYNRAAAPSPLYSGPERFGSIVKEPGALGPSQGEAAQSQAMALQTAMIAAMRKPPMSPGEAQAILDASKIKGKVYHGTSKDADFDKFRTGQRGAWFTKDPAEASSYAVDNDSRGPVMDRYSGQIVEKNNAPRVIPAYLDIRNPYIITDADMKAMQSATNYAKVQREIFNRAKWAGHDGVDMGNGQVVAFKPDQIHNAISGPLAEGLSSAESEAAKTLRGPWGSKEIEAMQKADKSLRKRLPVDVEVEPPAPGAASGVHRFQAYSRGEPVGFADMERVAYPPEWQKVPRSNYTEVDPYTLRRGVASQIYDEAEKFFGEPVQPSRNQTGEGKAFWAGRRVEKEGRALQEKVAELIKSPMEAANEGLPRAEQSRLAPRLTEKRRDILFDRKGPANEPIRDLQSWEMGNRKVRRGDDIEMMPTDEVAKFREFERDREGVGARPDSKVNIDELVKDIDQNGIASPLTMIYYQGDKTALLGEGNHRLAAAIRMGLPEVPVRVTRYTGESPVKEVGNRAQKVPGIEPDRTGYVRADLLPSQIGVKSRPLTPAELAENGRVIKGAYPAGFRTQAQIDATNGMDVLRHIEEQKRAKLPPMSIEALIEELRGKK